MKLEEILRHKGSKVWTVRDNQTVSHAIEVLNRHKIGAVIVLNHFEEIVGILSERDIIRKCQGNLWGLEIRPISQLMTQDVITAGPEDEVEHVMVLMTEHRIRHVPVVSDGKLEGIVSIGDIVKALLQESAYEVQSLKEFIYGSSAN